MTSLIFKICHSDDLSKVMNLDFNTPTVRKSYIIDKHNSSIVLKCNWQFKFIDELPMEKNSSVIIDYLKIIVKYLIVLMDILWSFVKFVSKCHNFVLLLLSFSFFLFFFFFLLSSPHPSPIIVDIASVATNIAPSIIVCFSSCSSSIFSSFSYLSFLLTPLTRAITTDEPPLWHIVIDVVYLPSHFSFSFAFFFSSNPSSLTIQYFY